MAVNRRAVPDAVRLALAGAVSRLRPVARAHTFMAERDEVDAIDPIPLFAVEPGGPDTLFEFVPHGWRAFISDGRSGVMAVDLAQADSLEFDRYLSGPRIDAAIEVAAALDNDELPDGLELRLIESTDLKIGAYWFAGAAERFIVYAGDAADIGRAQSRLEFELSLLRRQTAIRGESSPAEDEDDDDDTFEQGST